MNCLTPCSLYSSKFTSFDQASSTYHLFPTASDCQKSTLIVPGGAAPPKQNLSHSNVLLHFPNNYDTFSHIYLSTSDARKRLSHAPCMPPI